MEYNFQKVEEHWQKEWKLSGSYKVENDFSKPPCYVLDMFPYPSGAGLHVGHPLGYIASDIYSRYKRLKGFNVLHPMGFDSFGLPAEQYAIETGQHPAETTEKNIATFKKQLDKIGFSYDWDREVRTSDPNYYRWTQWIFLKLFKSWYNHNLNKAESINTLINKLEQEGSAGLTRQPESGIFTADEWENFSTGKKEEILMQYRLAFSSFGEVNWCEELGTVLANDEVVNGLSERGGFPVIKKKMRQWYMRITDYADRLLQGLDTVDFSESMKEMQKNWIGRSEGAEIQFVVENSELTIGAYTTRPDTIFGVDFIVLAPEHTLVQSIVTSEQQKEIDAYLKYVKSRSERERMSEVKQVTGCFTGAFAINPFNENKIPVYIAEYVLAGYGTGAIMGVPSGDQRDFLFAQQFNIPITNIIGEHFTGEQANPTKEAILTNSGFMTGLIMKEAIQVALDEIEQRGIGRRKVNFKMRDAGFSRQRYWGEPFPIMWKDGTAIPMNEDELPLELPFIQKYVHGPEGEGPLANEKAWVEIDEMTRRETSTMPGYAGSSWYFLRYMDPHNNETFCDKKFSDYWGQVDVYIGGTEHAVGHLLYSRMWTKFLFDMGLISFDEPFKKLVNQGMITGKSYFFNLERDPSVRDGLIITSYQKQPDSKFMRFKYGHQFVEADGRLTKKNLQKSKLVLPYNIIWEEDDTIFLKEESEKMSKSKFNVDNPDDVVNRYGADTFRMYEMFLGPVEQSKPWDTKGIEGVHRFLKKLWRLFNDDIKGKVWNEEKATDAELKILHRAIRKIDQDTQGFSFNTAVSAFMVAVNDLSDIKCHKKEILEPLLILLTPYAPHISEELWHQLGNNTTILNATFPLYDEKLLTETTKEYPVSVNGKLRTSINLSLELSQAEVEEIILNNDVIKKWLADKPAKKIIYVKGKMINLVV